MLRVPSKKVSKALSGPLPCLRAALMAVSLFVLLFFAFPVLAQEPSHFPRMMKTAGFWISRHPSPDAVIMSPESIDQFNTRLRTDNKLTKDIFTIIQDQKTES